MSKKRKFVEKEKRSEVLKKFKQTKSGKKKTNDSDCFPPESEFDQVDQTATSKSKETPTTKSKETPTTKSKATPTTKRKASKEDLERKREKNRIKKLRERQLKRGEIKLDNTNKDKALNYLKMWQNDRDNWKFEKCKQTWLLRNIYKSISISDEIFNVLLYYIDSIQGNSREKTLQDAESIIKELDKKWIENDEKDEYDIHRYERARKIVQLL